MLTRRLRWPTIDSGSTVGSELSAMVTERAGRIGFTSERLGAGSSDQGTMLYRPHYLRDWLSKLFLITVKLLNRMYGRVQCVCLDVCGAQLVLGSVV